MSFLGRLFGEKTGPSKEVKAIFEKIHLITTTDSLQNSLMPEPLYKQMEANGGVDEIPSSFGNFGHAITNPIPVNGSLGEVLYLSNIATAKKAKTKPSLPPCRGCGGTAFRTALCISPQAPTDPRGGRVLQSPRRLKPVSRPPRAQSRDGAR